VLVGFGVVYLVAVGLFSGVEPGFDESGNGCRSLLDETSKDLILPRIVLATCVVAWVLTGTALLVRSLGWIVHARAQRWVTQVTTGVLGVVWAAVGAASVALLDGLAFAGLGVLAVVVSAAVALLVGGRLVVVEIVGRHRVAPEAPEPDSPGVAWLMAGWILVPLSVPAGLIALYAGPLERFLAISSC